MEFRFFLDQNIDISSQIPMEKGESFRFPLDTLDYMGYYFESRNATKNYILTI